jgi:hypothetical protein
MVVRWLSHQDGGALAMKIYTHLCNQHSATMAKLVNFAPNNPNALQGICPKFSNEQANRRHR